MGPAIETESGHGAAGFTLIETLVAVAILAVLAVGASLAVGARAPGGGDAARFAAAYGQARALAIAGAERRGLAVDARAMTPMMWRDGAWGPAGAARPWRGRVLWLPRDGAGADPDAPAIVFLPDGRTTAFAMSFPGMRCESDGWTGLTCG